MFTLGLIIGLIIGFLTGFFLLLSKVKDIIEAYENIKEKRRTP